ncbi:MAG: hypothetical protein P4L40_03220, partial [Terracidiphilus sp.]|nr:hypothetical protein [Terracidiphilus sp.]
MTPASVLSAAPEEEMLALGSTPVRRNSSVRCGLQAAQLPADDAVSDASWTRATAFSPSLSVLLPAPRSSTLMSQSAPASLSALPVILGSSSKWRAKVLRSMGVPIDE